MLDVNLLTNTGFRIVRDVPDDHLGKTLTDMRLEIACTWHPANNPPVRIEAVVPLSKETLADMAEQPNGIVQYLPQIIGMVEKCTGVQYDDDTVRALANFIGMTLQHELQRRIKHAEKAEA